jgi:hypothetical protein
MRAGDLYVKEHSRDSLRILGSVGEPINPEAWRWCAPGGAPGAWWLGGCRAAPCLLTSPQPTTPRPCLTPLPTPPFSNLHPLPHPHPHPQVPRHCGRRPQPHRGHLVADRDGRPHDRAAAQRVAPEARQRDAALLRCAQGAAPGGKGLRGRLLVVPCTAPPRPRHPCPSSHAAPSRHRLSPPQAWCPCWWTRRATSWRARPRACCASSRRGPAACAPCTATTSGEAAGAPRAHGRDADHRPAAHPHSCTLTPRQRAATVKPAPRAVSPDFILTPPPPPPPQVRDQLLCPLPGVLLLRRRRAPRQGRLLLDHGARGRRHQRVGPPVGLCGVGVGVGALGAGPWRGRLLLDHGAHGRRHQYVGSPVGLCTAGTGTRGWGHGRRGAGTL